MPTTAQMTAAPGEITLGDNKYLMAPMVDQDWGTSERWVQDRFVTLAKRHMIDLESNQRAELFRDILSKAASLTVDSPESLRLMASMAGAVKLLWLGLHRNHPELTEADILEALSDKKSGQPDAKAVADAMDKFDLVNDTVAPAETEGDEAASKKNESH